MSMLAAPQKTHEFWRERRTGEIWAVELVDGVVVGCCGPLHHKEVVASYLPTFEYAPAGADRIEAGRDGFDLVDPALVDAGS
ncbi:MAG TPA: hypothetical protein VFB42_11410 [Gaiellaceae bacterium]|nr:hypothetical protein [Gaiellaceae bacterium]